MNDEPRYSLPTVVAMACWLMTGGLLLVAWTAYALGGSVYAAILVAETACACSAVAAVMHIKLYAARVCRTIRLTAGIDRSSSSADLRRFPTPR